MLVLVSNQRSQSDFYYLVQINELKKMLKKSTAVLILENGEPSIVVVDYKTYKDLLDPDSRTSDGGGAAAENSEVTLPGGPASNPGELELLERINKDILALKEQIEEEEKGLGID